MSLQSSTPIWVPTNNKDSRMYNFMQHVNEKKNLQLKTYENLWKWSIENICDFWEIFFHYSGIIHHGVYEKVLDTTQPMDSIPKWFSGVTLNYAENMLHPSDDGTAIISQYEVGDTVILSHRDLYRKVCQVSHMFRRYGLQKGDIIAAILPHDYRTVVCMLAGASLGCVWTSISPELQAKGIIMKLNGIKPRIVIGIDITHYGGKTFNHLSKLNEFATELSCIEIAIIFSDHLEGQLSSKCMSFKSFVKIYGKSDDISTDIVYEHVPFDHPLFILYTSGTTGPSKKLVHSSGGTLIQLVKEHFLHGNLSKNDVFFFYTSPGWVMWNWSVTALVCKSTLLLYEGSPVRPDPYILWKICSQNKVTVFGAGSAYYYVMEKENVKPNTKYSFESLRFFLSTGSFLAQSSYYYLRDYVKADIPVCSLAAATDIISSFGGYNIYVPIYPGEVQNANLGMDVRCYDDKGESVFDQFGELVCAKPFPSMPVFFMNDDNNVRYKETYFSKFPGVWTHGDYCLINSNTKGIVISGRSDSTLNVNGIRLGTSEIYNVVEQVEGVTDSLCVCQDLEDGRERMILFVSHKNGNDDFGMLIDKIKKAILVYLSPRYIPSLILPAPEIPYTITGKKIEILIRKILSGKPYTINAESLKNTSCLDYFIGLKL